MNPSVFDVLSLRALDGVSRRASIAGLGAAAIAALSSRATAEAKKGKKKRNKNKNKEVRQCGRQEGECLAAVIAACDERPQPLACRNRFLDCCEPFADCNSERAVACFFFDVLP